MSLNFSQIEQLIESSRYPIPDLWLEGLQDKFQQYENYYRFLYHLVLARKPKVALEIGTWYGIGSAYMAGAAASCGGRVIGLDINSHEMTMKSINDSYKNYHFILGNSTSLDVYEQVNKIIQEYGPIGVVYQDSSHHYEASRVEWALYSQLLEEGAIWVCDDITPAFHDPLIDPPGKGMVQYFEGLPEPKRLYKDVLHYGNTQGILLR